MFVICYIYAFLFTIYIQFVTERLHMGGWVAGAQTPASTKRKTCFVLERGERGGAAAAPAGRKLPQEARAARSRGRAKTRCRRHALKRWLGSGKVSTDGLQGRSPLRQPSAKLASSSSAASGAAQPPRPQGASFRRKREPRGVGEGENSV